MRRTAKLRAKSCRRKKGYKDQATADHQARRATVSKGELILAYECDQCGKWHIGHTDLSLLKEKISRRQAVPCAICATPLRATRLRRAVRNRLILFAATCSRNCAKKFEILASSPEKRPRLYNYGLGGSLHKDPPSDQHAGLSCDEEMPNN